VKESISSQQNIPLPPAVSQEKIVEKPEGFFSKLLKKKPKEEKIKKNGLLSSLLNKKEKSIKKVQEATPFPIKNADRSLNFEIRKANPPAIPRDIDKTKLDLRYPLLVPYAYAHIYWDANSSELIYKIEEPQLMDEEKETLGILEKGIRELINISFISVNEEKVLIEYLEKNVRILLDELSITLEKNSYLKIVYYLYRNFIGLNQIDPLMADPHIEDIECNGINSPVYIVHRVLKNVKTNIIYQDADELKNFVEKLAQKAGKYISYSNPIMDGTLPDKSRVNATFTQDISSKGPTFTIRKFTKIPYTPIKLMELGTVSPDFLAYAWMAIEYGMNILIVGGTGSGKCVTGDTKIYLPNGKTSKIKDLVEEKFKHSRIVENKGWEFCYGDGTEILSLDRSSLKIENKKITRFWRHKAPKKLYKIVTSTGREITTTPEHPFFGLDNGSLKEIKAENIKLKERIAVPRRLNIESKSQIINPLKSLSDERDIYVKNQQKRVKILTKKIIEKYNLDNMKDLTKLLKIKYRTYGSWIENNAIPLHIFTKLHKETNIEMPNILELKAKTSSNSLTIKDIKTKKDLFRFIALLISDGHLTKHHVQFHNTDISLLKNFLELGEKVFNIKGRIEYPKKRTPKAVIGSCVISRILNKTFKVPYGKKASKIRVPEELFNEDNECMGSFISGIIDSEGHIGKGYIEIATTSKRLAEEISTLLLYLNIIPSFAARKNHFRIYLSGQGNILKVKEKIPIIKENKIYSLQKILEKKNCTTNRDTIPNISNLVKNLRVNLNLNQSEFAQNIGISRRLVGMWESGIRNPSYSTLNLLNEYLDSNVPEINNLCNSDILWDEVRKIEILKDHNEEYVYDLTVEPDHNFLAGNIPMIIHNTSLLNALAFFMPPQARVVSIEDTREIQLIHENWLPTVSREGVGGADMEGRKQGEVSLFDLLKESFRQRPDFVIVGEIRGKEAYVLFQGMASGHASMSTMHANDVATVITRLETPPINLSASLVENLDAVIMIGHASINGNDVRKVKSVEEVIKVGSGAQGTQLNTPFRWDPKTNRIIFNKQSYIFNKIMQRTGMSPQQIQLEFLRRANLLFRMYQKKISGFEQVQKIIHEYYKTPKKVLSNFNLR